MFWMKRLNRRIYLPIALAIVVMLTLPWVAFADNVVNDVVVGGSDTITAGGSTIVGYKINANGGDGNPGCNASVGSAITVGIVVEAGATSSVASLTFTACNSFQYATFSSNAAGSYEVTHTVSGGVGTTNNQANWTLIVDEATPTDTTAPTITLMTPADGAVYKLNQVVNADFSCEDEVGGSGVASCVGTVANGTTIDTSSVGTKSFTVNASDNAGNHAQAVTHNYTVTYDFLGFSAPVNNGDVLNVAKAGQAIPLKFQVLDANGAPVINVSNVIVKVVSLSCATGTSVDAVEEYATGSSGLQNLGGGFYQFNWKTPTTYANSCKTMHLDLGEGLTHTALFQFKK